MIKRTIKETVREYDADGKVVRETVTETTEDDDTMYFPQFQTFLLQAMHRLQPRLQNKELRRTQCRELENLKRSALNSSVTR